MRDFTKGKKTYEKGLVVREGVNLPLVLLLVLLMLLGLMMFWL